MVISHVMLLLTGSYTCQQRLTLTLIAWSLPLLPACSYFHLEYLYRIRLCWPIIPLYVLLQLETFPYYDAKKDNENKNKINWNFRNAAMRNIIYEALSERLLSLAWSSNLPCSEACRSECQRRQTEDAWNTSLSTVRQVGHSMFGIKRPKGKVFPGRNSYVRVLYAEPRTAFCRCREDRITLGWSADCSHEASAGKF